MIKRQRVLLLSSILLLLSNVAIATPETPTGLCMNIQNCTESPQITKGLFPGSNLKFRPGFILATTENQDLGETETHWQALFKDRKEAYLPKGIYSGVVRRLNWWRFYHTNNNEGLVEAKYQAGTIVRPKDPSDHNDPVYNWKPLDDIFTINAVKNEGALVIIGIMEVGYSGYPKAPKWLENAPFNGIFYANKNRVLPAYHRYTGPDARGMTNVGLNLNSSTTKPIVDEFVMFQKAMHDHLVATGNINKVMGVQTSEFYGGSYSGAIEDFYHGVGTRAQALYDIWEQSQIPVYKSSIGGGKTMTNILAQYVRPTPLAITHPDMKLSNTADFYTDRFSIDGAYQSDKRHLMQSTEANGFREYTYFSPETPNPWGVTGQHRQTASHILWALSGVPKGRNKDSGLGYVGDDPAGLMPVHNVIVNLSGNKAHSLEEWREAIDTFGPPGTFAFPYLPEGYIK